MTDYAKCVVCGGKVTQSFETFETKCAVCGKNLITHYVCENGHHVCNHCKLDVISKDIKNICLKSKSTNPVEIALELMDSPIFKNIIGCRYYVIPAVSLFTAEKNLGKKYENFDKTLDRLIHLSMLCPSSLCKMCGFCGMSAVTGLTLKEYLSKENTERAESILRAHAEMSINAIEDRSFMGSKNCCNRNVIISVLAGIKFCKDYLWIDMDYPSKIVCRYSKDNPRCNKEKCRLYLGYLVKDL